MWETFQTMISLLQSFSRTMSITTDWAMPSHNLLESLVPDAVHVWRVPLIDSPERALQFRNYLSQDECTKADQYRTPQPQYQFVVTRGILRTLLSRYLGISQAQLHFGTKTHGKPILLTPSSRLLQFNVSHTRGMALIALTLQQAVGIDVEWIDRKIQDGDIAKRYFSPRESAELASLVPVERTGRFFSYWTCKEAYLKMRGTGITGGLAQCEISLEPGQPKARLSLLDQQESKEDFSLYQIRAGAEHVGAVAMAISSPHISYWNWQDEYLA